MGVVHGMHHACGIETMQVTARKTLVSNAPFRMNDDSIIDNRRIAPQKKHVVGSLVRTWSALDDTKILPAVDAPN